MHVLECPGQADSDDLKYQNGNDGVKEGRKRTTNAKDVALRLLPRSRAHNWPIEPP